jgi:hypothetical protein
MLAEAGADEKAAELSLSTRLAESGVNEFLFLTQDICTKKLSVDIGEDKNAQGDYGVFAADAMQTLYERWMTSRSKPPKPDTVAFQERIALQRAPLSLAEQIFNNLAVGSFDPSVVTSASMAENLQNLTLQRCADEICRASLPAAVRLGAVVPTTNLFSACACALQLDIPVISNNQPGLSVTVESKEAKTDAQMSGEELPDEEEVEGQKADINLVTLESSKLFGSVVIPFFYKTKSELITPQEEGAQPYIDVVVDTVGQQFIVQHIQICNRFFYWQNLRAAMLMAAEHIYEAVAIEDVGARILKLFHSDMCKLAVPGCEAVALALAWKTICPAGVLQDAADRSPTLELERITGEETFKRSIGLKPREDIINMSKFAVVNDNPLEYLFEPDHPFHIGWMLMLWEKQVMSACKDISFLERYCVLDYQLLDRWNLMRTGTRESDVRRPLVVQIADSFYVQIIGDAYPRKLERHWQMTPVAHDAAVSSFVLPNVSACCLSQPAPFVLIKCQNVYHALYMWIFCISRCYRSKLESGVKIDVLYNSIAVDNASGVASTAALSALLQRSDLSNIGF